MRGRQRDGPGRAEDAREGQADDCPQVGEHGEWEHGRRKVMRSVTKWGAVVTVIAAAYPTSKYAELGEDELRDTARIWAQMMDDVPLSAVEALCRRVLKARANPFAPTLGDFRTAWAAWDYWAELNRVEPGPRHLALPEPAPHLNGVGARSYRAQKAAHAARGTFVCCHCVDASGVHVPTVLWQAPGGETLERETLEGEVWVCAAERCGFVWAVADTAGAPIFEKS